jgi:hypothetical protein
LAPAPAERIQSTCWSFWRRLNCSSVRITSRNRQSVAYQQRLNGPNVKCTSRSTVGGPQFVVLLRGPSEQPESAPVVHSLSCSCGVRANSPEVRRLFTVCRWRSHKVVQLPFPGFLDYSGSARTEVFGHPAAAAFSHGKLWR